MFQVIIVLNNLVKYLHICYVLKGDDDCRHTVCTADVNQFLQHIEKKFSDILIPTNQIVTQEYIGKGCTCIYIYACMLQYVILIQFRSIWIST